MVTSEGKEKTWSLLKTWWLLKVKRKAWSLLKARSSGSSSLAAGGDQFTASGDSHPAANLPHSAASATIQEPSPFVRKRLRKETTVPHDDARASGGPHLAATDTDRVMKRSLDDPYTSSAKPATNSV